MPHTLRRAQHRIEFRRPLRARLFDQHMLARRWLPPPPPYRADRASPPRSRYRPRHAWPPHASPPPPPRRETCAASFCARSAAASQHTRTRQPCSARARLAPINPHPTIATTSFPVLPVRSCAACKYRPATPRHVRAASAKDPKSALISFPVTPADCSDARYTIRSAAICGSVAPDATCFRTCSYSAAPACAVPACRISCSMAVFIGPGAMQLTRIPSPATSAAMVSLNLISPHLAVAYAED